ncbi:MAG: hypothetical protein J5I59_10995 [Saprospiraceae bacterium]|nr:hypothetical protein [Saprospiraceae bacterium]
MKVLFSFCIFMLYGICLHTQSIPWYAINGQDVESAIRLNPAYLLQDNLTSSIKLSSLSVDYNNNFAYIKDKSFFNLLFNARRVTIPELEAIAEGNNPAIGLDRDLKGYEMKLNETDISRMYLSGSVVYSGPSYYHRRPDGLNWGLSTGIILKGGINNYPGNITYGPYRTYSGGDFISVGKFSGYADGYLHINFNASKEFQLSNSTRFSVGGSIRYFGSFGHAEIINDEQIDRVTFLQRDEIQASNLLLKYQYTHSNPEDIAGQFIRGNGVGGDIGIFFEQKLNYPQISFFKGGLSVTDLGFLKYGNSLRSGSFDVNTPTILAFGKYDGFKGFDQLVDSFEYVITRQSENSHLSRKGGVSYLPANIQMTLACGFMNYGRVHLYVSSPLVGWSPEAFQIGFIPELTFKYINVLVPFSYNQWTGFRLGAGFNISFLTFGTDDVRSLKNREQLKSGSFYLGISLNKFVQKVKRKK